MCSQMVIGDDVFLIYLFWGGGGGQYFTIVCFCMLLMNRLCTFFMFVPSSVVRVHSWPHSEPTNQQLPTIDLLSIRIQL